MNARKRSLLVLAAFALSFGLFAAVGCSATVNDGSPQNTAEDSSHLYDNFSFDGEIRLGILPGNSDATATLTSQISSSNAESASLLVAFFDSDGDLVGAFPFTWDSSNQFAGGQINLPENAEQVQGCIYAYCANDGTTWGDQDAVEQSGADEVLSYGTPLKVGIFGLEINTFNNGEREQH